MTLMTLFRSTVTALLLTGAAVALAGTHAVPSAAAQTPCRGGHSGCAGSAPVAPAPVPVTSRPASVPAPASAPRAATPAGGAAARPAGAPASRGGQSVYPIIASSSPSPSTSAVTIELQPNQPTYLVGQRVQICARVVRGSGLLRFSQDFTDGAGVLQWDREILDGANQPLAPQFASAGQRVCFTGVIEDGDQAVIATLNGTAQATLSFATV